MSDERKADYEKAIDKPMAAFDVNPVIVVQDNKIVLAKRISSVQEGGKWSMPGGKVFVGETIEEALKRMTLLKTGIEIELLFQVILKDNISALNLSLVGVYDNPGRDPRSHVVGLAFFCGTTGDKEIVTATPGGNSEDVNAFSFKEIEKLDLAFDHREVLNDVIRLIQGFENVKKSGS